MPNAKAARPHLGHDSKFMVASIVFLQSRAELWCRIKESEKILTDVQTSLFHTTLS